MTTVDESRTSVVNFITDVLWMMFDCLPKVVRVVEMRNKSVSLINLQV